MSITEEQTIWYPGIYHGRTDGDYAKTVDEFINVLGMDSLIELVQQRARDDGEWAIENGHVGDNEDKMRRFMAFVSDEKNIRQCVAHIQKEEMSLERTADWVCRDLANASKWMIR